MVARDHSTERALSIDTDVQPEVLSALLAYVYTGECELADELLCSLLQASSLFQVPPLQAACASEIERRLRPSNAVQAWLIADELSVPSLADAAKDMVLKEFVSISKGPSFRRLTAPMLRVLAASHLLMTPSEEAVHVAIMEWAAARQPAPSNETVLSLLSHVRYPLCATAFVRSARLDSPLSTPQGQTLLLEAFSSAWYVPERRVKTRDEEREDIRLSRGELTWTIPGFSTVNQTKLLSPLFVSGAHAWRVKMFPQGNAANQLAMYLDAADSPSQAMRSGWWKQVHFSITIHNRDATRSVTKQDDHRFSAESTDWGSRQFVQLQQLREPSAGFVVDDQLVVTAKVQVEQSSDDA